jgi:hypothetical protein
MKLVITIFVFVGLLVALGIAAFITDTYYFHKVWSAKTPDELKAACTDSWYKNGRLQDLPAQCVQFYKVNVQGGIN